MQKVVRYVTQGLEKWANKYGLTIDFSHRRVVQAVYHLGTIGGN